MGTASPCPRTSIRKTGGVWSGLRVAMATKAVRPRAAMATKAVRCGLDGLADRRTFATVRLHWSHPCVPGRLVPAVKSPPSLLPRLTEVVPPCRDLNRNGRLPGIRWPSRIPGHGGTPQYSLLSQWLRAGSSCDPRCRKDAVPGPALPRWGKRVRPPIFLLSNGGGAVRRDAW